MREGTRAKVHPKTQIPIYTCVPSMPPIDHMCGIPRTRENPEHRTLETRRSPGCHRALQGLTKVLRPDHVDDIDLMEELSSAALSASKGTHTTLHYTAKGFSVGLRAPDDSLLRFLTRKLWAPSFKPLTIRPSRDDPTCKSPALDSSTPNTEPHANAGSKDKTIAIEILRAEFAARQTGPRAFLGIDIIEEAMRDGAEESGPAMIAREFGIQVYRGGDA
jgi:hypothetical protein